jgi:hypothetical protein
MQNDAFQVLVRVFDKQAGNHLRSVLNTADYIHTLFASNT